MGNVMHMTNAPAGGIVPDFTRGDRLRKAREITGLDQRRFAEQLGVSHGTVANAENDRSVRDITIRMWALVTGVDLGWLQTGEAPHPGDGDGSSAEVRHQGLEPRTR